MVGRSACPRCERRSWLLGVLSVRLDFRARDEARLLALLELDDDDLIDAIAGRRRREIRTSWKQYAGRSGEYADQPSAHAQPPRGAPASARDGTQAVARDARVKTCTGRVETVCPHTYGYPKALLGRAGAPQMLYVRGTKHRLARLAERPSVAIVGGARPTDHGLETARSLARGLGASGVTIVSVLSGGVSAAVLSGARESDAPVVVAMAGGLRAVPASRREVYARLPGHGCAIAELACSERAHRWCRIAVRRTVAGLARLTIVVEADQSPADLRTALVAHELGRTVAAMPGRVSSPASAGTNAMLRDGAPLVRDATDALELLSGIGARARGGWLPEHSEPGLAGPRPAHTTTRTGTSGLEPRLRAVHEQVCGGRDTPGKLIGAHEDAGAIMLALAELEVMGLLGRGDGGRYVPSNGQCSSTAAQLGSV